MPIAKKVEGGYKIVWLRCQKCGSPMDKMQKPIEGANYQCLVCNHKAKIDEKLLEQKIDKLE